MNRRSFIQWCDYTWNPWRGCTKVSPGCTNCYAEKLVTSRLGGEWGKGKPRQRASEAILKAPFKWNKKPWICDTCGEAWGLKDRHVSCGGTTFHRARVFLGSLMDIFDEEVPIEWLSSAMDTVRQCTAIDFLLVTKRPELWYDRIGKVFDLLPDSDLRHWIANWRMRAQGPPNIWLITSAEDQYRLEERVPQLLKIPAAIHGLSCEPLLGPLDLNKAGATYSDVEGAVGDPGLTRTFEVGKVDWVIAGGESGPDARACSVNWIADVQRQCKEAGVAYFAKQLGRFPTTSNANLNDWPDNTFMREYGTGAASALIDLKDKKGGNMAEWPEELRVRQWPEVAR